MTDDGGGPASAMWTPPAREYQHQLMYRQPNISAAKINPRYLQILTKPRITISYQLC